MTLFFYHDFLEEEKEGAEKSTNYKTNIVLSSPYVDNWHNI